MTQEASEIQISDFFRSSDLGFGFSSRGRGPVVLWSVVLSLRRDQLFPKSIAEQNFLEEIGFVLRDDWRLAGIDGEAKRESCALAGLAPRIDTPAMMVDNKVAGHKVDAIFHRRIASDDKRVENQAQSLLRHAGTIVAD